MHLLMGLGLSSAFAQDAEPITRSLPASAPEVRLLAGRGTVSIRHTPGLASSQVTITPGRWYEACDISFSGDATAAIAEITEAGERSPWRCTAHFDIELAGPTDVFVDMGRARVDVDGAPGDLTVNLGRGRVTGRAERADVTISGTGRVALWGLEEAARASVGVGGVSLAYAQEIAGTIQASTRLGRVKVALPYGSLIEDATSTTVGLTRSAVPSREGHPTRLEASATVGRIRVDTDLSALSASLEAAAPDQTTADSFGM